VTYTAPDPWSEYDRAARFFAQHAHAEGTRQLDVTPACAALVEQDPAAFARRIRQHARQGARHG
jgi:hypothetical protein